MRALVLACLSLSVSGCVPYPVHKQLQPATRVRVVTEAGEPLIGARVLLLANTYPYGREHHRELASTDATGAAVFPERREWRTESLMIHGWQEFFWNVCVSMPGRVTHLTEHRSAAGFDTDATVVLRSGPSTACPGPEDNG